eukprot:1156395-Pelagomonas_calceolata.AAC.8
MAYTSSKLACVPSFAEGLRHTFAGTHRCKPLPARTSFQTTCKSHCKSLPDAKQLNMHIAAIASHRVNARTTVRAAHACVSYLPTA